MWQVATVFFSEAISFVPCFKYSDSEDMILFTSRNIHYLVDKAGQFNENYYGMKHELLENILSEVCYVDLNDEDPAAPSLSPNCCASLTALSTRGRGKVG